MSSSNKIKDIFFRYKASNSESEKDKLIEDLNAISDS
jgi:hypothetical protein